MSKANDLIERMEAETGQRIDDNGGDNNAMAGLFGALSRIMGKSPRTYTEKDDVAVGLLLRHRTSPEYARQEQAKAMLADLLVSGVSPDDIREILG